MPQLCAFQSWLQPRAALAQVGVSCTAAAWALLGLPKPWFGDAVVEAAGPSTVQGHTESRERDTWMSAVICMFGSLLQFLYRYGFLLSIICYQDIQDLSVDLRLKRVWTAWVSVLSEHICCFVLQALCSACSVSPGYLSLPSFPYFPAWAALKGWIKVLKKLGRHHLLCHQVQSCLLTGAAKCSHSLDMESLALQSQAQQSSSFVFFTAQICRLTFELDFFFFYGTQLIGLNVVEGFQFAFNKWTNSAFICQKSHAF